MVLCTLWLKLGRVRLNEGQFAQAEQLGRKALSIAGGNLAFESEALDLISGALRAQDKARIGEKAQCTRQYMSILSRFLTQYRAV